MSSSWAPPAHSPWLPDLSESEVPASLHPLDHVDRETIYGLLTATEPSDTDLVHAARLITRYRDSLLSSDLRTLLSRVLRNWSITTEELFCMTRAIWRSGGPAQLVPQDDTVGSGADVEA